MTGLVLDTGALIALKKATDKQPSFSRVRAMPGQNRYSGGGSSASVEKRAQASPVGALRLRSLLGLRDSLFSFDIERNARGEVIGMMFFGRGWGHGVGMCQVGAYGMVLDGATYDQILKTYYSGIELKKLY